MGTPTRLSALLIGSAVLLGATVGVGLFTFGYAEGLSYFSWNRRACVNCHIMNDQYRSWTRSSHHAVAACVDCHLPHSLLPKLIARAENVKAQHPEFELWSQGVHARSGVACADCHRPYGRPAAAIRRVARSR